MFNFGVMYYKGKGILNNFNKALEWWEKAAELGNVDAIDKLEKLNSKDN